MNTDIDNCHSMHCPVRVVKESSKSDKELEAKIEFVKGAFQCFVGYESTEGFKEFLNQEQDFAIVSKVETDQEKLRSEIANLASSCIEWVDGEMTGYDILTLEKELKKYIIGRKQ